MKNNTNTSIYRVRNILNIILVVIIFTACQNRKSIEPDVPNPNPNPNETPIPPSENRIKPGTAAPSENEKTSAVILEDFSSREIIKAQYQISTIQKAMASHMLSHTDDAKISSFAQMMNEYHSNVLEQLKKYENKTDKENTLNVKQQIMIKDFQAIKTDTKNYLQMTITLNKENIALLEEAVLKTNQTDLKTFYDKIKNEIAHHLNEANSLVDSPSL